MAAILSSTTALKREAWRIDRSVLLVILACVAVVIGAGIVSPGVLSLGYLLQQLQIASIVGVLATGAMLVILLGQIDLSLPLTITSAAIVATSLAGSGNATLAALAIPAGLLCGLVIGAVNGLGGTSILGGSGSYPGTFVGAIFITLLSSVLWLMQIQDAVSQIVFDAIILIMLSIHRTKCSS